MTISNKVLKRQNGLGFRFPTIPHLAYTYHIYHPSSNSNQSIDYSYRSRKFALSHQPSRHSCTIIFLKLHFESTLMMNQDQLRKEEASIFLLILSLNTQLLALSITYNQYIAYYLKVLNSCLQHYFFFYELCIKNYYICLFLTTQAIFSHITFYSLFPPRYAHWSYCTISRQFVTSGLINLQYFQMAYSNNNSRNVANLLRYQALEPIQPRRQQVPPPEPLIQQNTNGRPRNQIPIEDVFTPEEGVQRRTYKRKTPLSSGNGVQGPLYPTNYNGDDTQAQSLKIRLDQIVKYYDQRHRNLQANLSERLNGLQNLVIREMPKVDNATMMKSDIVSFKQAIKDLRKQVQYQNQQIVTLKAMADQKSFNEVSIANDAKQKQKMTVLFMEVVRLSDMVEKMENGIGSVGRNYESRLQQLEHKLSNSEKNIALMSQRTTNGNQILSELGDKLIERLQTAENNLLTLGHERVKDKQTVNQLLIQSQRMTDNMQNLLRTMQGDFQNKLQNRISQTINRLIAQHEQRINAQEQIRRNLDMRERINIQKQNNDKQEFRARYENMDVQIRNQFQRKQESIRQLQNFIQTQVKNVQKEVLIQASNRKEQESIVRAEMKRIQDSFRKQYDLYKTHQSDVLERIGQLVKEEVQVRVNSEVNLKKLTSDIANQLVNDLNGVKQAISSSNKKLNLSIRQVANDSSERAGQLSHYIDSQVKKVVDVVTQKYNKMKSVFTKLAQQLRQHLTNTQTNRVNVQKRLSVLQQNFQKLKNEVSTEIDEFYGDLDARLKDQKQYVQAVVFKKNNDLTVRVNKLQQYTNQYFQLLKGNIEQNKQILNNKITNNQEGRSPQSQQQMKELRTIVFNIRNLTQELKNQNRDALEQFRKQIKQKQGLARQGNLEKQNQLREKVEKNSSLIAKLSDELGQLQVKVNSLRAGGQNPDTSISSDKVKKLSDEISAMDKRIKQVKEQVTEESRNNSQQIIKLRTDITVLRGEVGALDHDIKKLSGGA